MSGELKGRVALVSGGGRGIGLAIAKDLAARGAKVLIADPGTGIDGTGADPKVAADAAADIGGMAFPQSIASPEAAQQAVKLAVDQLGGIDIVVNNAAILRDAFIFKGDAANFEAVLRTNLFAAFYLAAAATPFMREQQKAGRSHGRIVNITSSAGLYGNFGQAAYASAKAGLLGLTRVVAMDMARSQVTCNAVAPFAATRVTDSIRPANEAQAAYKERALKAEPRHVATLVSWLCSDLAANVTGQLFGVRGREVFLFSQPRPAAQLVTKGDGDLAALNAAAAATLAPHYTDLKTDLEVFNTDPVT
ncbi:MAG TPA: SDR family oxidoreductase [Ferrovibrio sp.]|jgi:NAD(P)-dependent dehydrogenase (short-subunit alcohol dehydrogenase family)|uniref:SDR family oxidoreductase n=1 Tax=Ferrovibrio sp. TaxID=1917215 RepID=UPI002B4B7894|nr:SDR family oxidoreductase [Ferrovibrio sp.]HLT76370.1 SDR family oxidoreductase [Ferrovibrio sp.]